MALDFFAGCVGGCAGVLVGYPFDTVKVRLQNQDSRCPKYKGMVNCFTTIIRKESAFGFYKGMSSPLAGVAVINAMIFGVYGNAQRCFKCPDAMSSVCVAGATAGIVQSVVSCPMELVKLRLQIQEDGIKQGGGVQQYKNPMDCIKKIRAKEGTRGLFRGFGITVVREAPAFAIYFASYEWFISLCRTNPEQSVSSLAVLMAGGCSGIVSWVFTYPIDLVKTRLQADGESGARKYRNSWDCALKSYRSEGASVFSRGLLSTVVRAFPTNAATFLAVTWTLQLCHMKPKVEHSCRPEDHRRVIHETLGLDAMHVDAMKPMVDFNTIIA